MATGTTSDPPKRVWEDRANVEVVTNHESLQPWLFLYNGFMLASSILVRGWVCGWVGAGGRGLWWCMQVHASLAW